MNAKDHRSSINQDFKKFNLEELTGSLMTFELQLESNSHDTQARRDKGISLQAKEDDSDLDEDEFALIARRFKKLYRNIKGGFKKGNSGKSVSKTDENCFKCGKPRHRIKHCPLWPEIEAKMQNRE